MMNGLMRGFERTNWIEFFLAYEQDGGVSNGPERWEGEEGEKW